MDSEFGIEIIRVYFSNSALRTPQWDMTVVPFIDLTRQYKGIEEEILSATKRVYEKGRFILGEEVLNFESEFARYCGVRYGVGVDPVCSPSFTPSPARGEGDIGII